MVTICKNCANHFEGTFCNNCGQTADTPRIEFRFLGLKVLKLLFSFFDKGIFFTVKELFTRPGNTIREYIEGKRVRHFEPIALLVTFASLYGILFNYFDIHIFKSVSQTGTTVESAKFDRLNEWIATHFSLFTVLFLPLSALGSFIAFRKQGYNYTEHLILNTFLASQKLLLRFAAFPFLVMYNGTAHLQTLLRIMILLDFMLMIWGYSQCFNRLRKLKSYLLSILSYLLFLIFYIIVFVIAYYIFGTTTQNAF